MDPIASPLLAIENPLEQFLKRDDHFGIFTHSAKTRIIVLALFLSYLVIFFLFFNFVQDELRDLEKMPEIFARLNNPQMTRLILYTSAGAGLVIGLMVLLYFMWAAIDIWGLQVWLSATELRVQNTVLSSYFKRWTGVGTLLLDDITELKGKKLSTYVIGNGKKLRFSPVDKVDILISQILSNAKNIEKLE